MGVSWRRSCRVALVFAWAALACTFPTMAESPKLAERTPVSAAPWPEGDGKFTFVVVGDRRGGADDEWPVFDRAVDEINLLRPDFAITVGDQIEGYQQDPGTIESQWKDFRQHADRLQVPLFVLPGNHDISNPVMLKWWRENVGRTYYAFDYRDCHFLVLNVQEQWVGNDSYLGPEQVRFAQEDLAQSKGARHTFVLLHQPVWTEPNDEWKQIEDALGDRKYTVFAGHTHNLTHEIRKGNRYLVVGTTKGVASPALESRITELGGFPHYTQVTVEGDTTHVAIIEPGGPVWPEDVAPRSFQDAVRNLARVEPLLPRKSRDGRFRTGLIVRFRNALPNPVELSLEMSPVGPDGWRPEGEARRAFTLAPGAEQAEELLFDVAESAMVPVPRLRYAATYNGKTLVKFDRNAPLFPPSALREIPEWRAVGPFAAGTISSTLPDNPREALPQVFLARGPERGPAEAPAPENNGQALAWRNLKTEDRFVNLARLCETPTCVLAYASCGVYSPSDRTVPAEFRADDYAQIFVNGTGIENERLFRTRSDATYVALPLKAGWNTVVIKCVNVNGGWTFRLLPADPASELRFAPEAE